MARCAVLTSGNTTCKDSHGYSKQAHPGQARVKWQGSGRKQALGLDFELLHSCTHGSAFVLPGALSALMHRHMIWVLCMICLQVPS